MTLRKKILLIIGAILVGSTAAFFFGSAGILLPGFATLEEQYAQQNVVRAREALEAEFSSLGATIQDWAGWDDTFSFIQDLNAEYVRLNLHNNALLKLNIDLVVFVDVEGRVVFSRRFGPEGSDDASTPERFREKVNPEDILLAHQRTKGAVTGLILVPDGLLIVGSHPITNSVGEGPARGTLIMCRFLDSLEIKKLSEQTRLEISLTPLDGGELPAGADSLLRRPDKILTKITGPDTISGYTALRDIYEKPVALLWIDMPRSIYAQGRTTIEYVTFFLVLLGLTIAATISVLIGRLVLAPLFRLGESVNKVDAKGDLAVRVFSTGTNEIARLAWNINKMLDSLEESRQELRRTCREMEDRVRESAAESAQAKEALESAIREHGLERGSLESAHNELERRIFEMTSELSAANEQFMLEMNGRKRAEEALRRERDFVESLSETATAIVLVLDPQGRVIRYNRHMENISGYRLEETKGQDYFSIFLPPEDRERIQALFTRALNVAPTKGYVNPIVTKDGTRRYIEWYDKTLLDEEGNLTGLLAVGQDVTEAKKAQDALRESEEKYRQIFECGVIGIFQSTFDGKYISLNKAHANLLGYDSPEEMKEKVNNIAQQVYLRPQERVEVLEKAEELQGIARFETELIRKDGRRIVVNQNIRLVRDEKGVPIYMEGFVEDITERKRAEQAVQESEKQLRFLSAKLLNAQEEERKRIAREVHDSIGSSLSAVKIHLEHALAQIRKGMIAPESIEDLISLTQDAMRECRRIMTNLRPSVFDHYGIVATVRWLCEQFRMMSPDVRIEGVVNIKEEEIPERLKIVILRIAQEALNNAAKSSKAHRVRLSLLKTGSGVELSIEDDGVGFDIHDTLAGSSDQRGLGLTSMRERAELTGGRFFIESAAGIGTTIQVRWPFEM